MGDVSSLRPYVFGWQPIHSGTTRVKSVKTLRCHLNTSCSIYFFLLLFFWCCLRPFIFLLSVRFFLLYCNLCLFLSLCSVCVVTRFAAHSLFCLPFRVPLSCPLSFGRLFFLSRPKASWEGGIVTVMVLLVLNDRNIWTKWYINMVHGSELSLDSSLLLSSRFVLSRLIPFRSVLMSHSTRSVSFVSFCLIRLVLSHSSRYMLRLVSFVSFSSYLSMKVLSLSTLLSCLEHVSIDMFHALFRLCSGLFMFPHVPFV